MAVLMGALAAFDAHALTLYFTKDEKLDNTPVLIFYGPSTTTNASANSSRIQAHLFSVAGHRSYARLTIDPNSPLYSAVAELPIDKQGEEHCRGLAFSLYKFFQDTQPAVQDLLRAQSQNDPANKAFTQAHAADLVSRMVRIDNAASVASQIRAILQEESLSWLDVDIFVPNSERSPAAAGDHGANEDDDGKREDQHRLLLGKHADIVESVGMPSFLPTSRLRRAPSRPTTLSRPKHLNQEALARALQEIEELCETESSYIQKLRDLSMCLRNAELNRGAVSRIKMGESAAFDMLKSLETISAVNRDFFAHAQQLQSEATNQINSLQSNSGTTEEQAPFILTLAKIFHDFIPRFSDPYKTFIRHSTQFPKLISEASDSPDTLLAYAAASVGDQRLKSWMIEPVQRLPRYSLFVDNISKALPASHPALRKLLKARDMINDICALDHEEDAGTPLVITRLRGLVEYWPRSAEFNGRLITATDAILMRTAGQPTSENTRNPRHILMLLTDSVLVFEKAEHSMLSSRGLLAELDRPKSSPSTLTVDSATQQQPPLRLISISPLECVQFSESESNRILHLTARTSWNSASKDNANLADGCVTTRFWLCGPYEGKTSKWTEEAARACIEHRFPEAVRDSTFWSLRSLPLSADGPGVIAAVYIQSPSDQLELSRSSFCRVIMSPFDESSIMVPQQRLKAASPNISVHVTWTSRDMVQFRCDSPTLASFLVDVDQEDFVNELRRCIRRMLAYSNVQADLATARTLVSRMLTALMSLDIRPSLSHSTSRGRLRPISPVKALSSFLGSAKDRAMPTRSSAAPSFNGQAQASLPTQRTIAEPSQGNSHETDSKTTVAPASDTKGGSFQQLEDTLDTYIIAINCRAGNILGKTLRNRAVADGIRVSELYNALNEDPSQHRAAAEVPIDVLFLAFEKFVRIEWCGRVGQILSAASLASMQSLFDNTASSHVQEQFSAMLAELSPQNRRAFTGIVQLLYDLLEASGNDGDRGAITATFAEILAPSQNYWECIPILDRLVEDMDWLFEGHASANTGFGEQPSRSPSRMHSVTSASVSSAGSSLRRRFGLGKLSRENSKLESESRMGQVWRNLSKRSQNSELDFAQQNRSKFSLSRTRSTERGQNSTRGQEASSRPCSAGSIQPESASTGSTRSAAAVGASLSGKHGTSPSRRRSSLSDLRELEHMTASRGYGQDRMPAYNGVATGRTGHKDNQVSATSPSRPGRALAGPVQGAETVSREARGRNDGHVLATSSGNISQRPGALSSEKIKSRLESEAAAHSAPLNQLRTELSEMRAQVASSDSRAKLGSSQPLLHRLELVESSVAEMRSEQARRFDAIHGEIERSLRVCEQQRKKMDKLLQETNEENEILYERYNSELQRLFEAGKDERMQAALQKLEEANRSATKYRAEVKRLKLKNAALKGELAGLQQG